MSVHKVVLNGPLYSTCEVYIDELIFHGEDEDFLKNSRDIFQTCRVKGVIVSAKKLIIGMGKIFLGHDRCGMLALVLGIN